MSKNKKLVPKEACVKQVRAYSVRLKKLVAESVKVKESETKLRMIIKESLIGIFESTIKGQILIANPALLKIMGTKTVEEANRIGLVNIYAYPEDRKRLVSLVKKGPVSGFESCFRQPCGRIVNVSLSAHLVTDARSGRRFLVGTCEDITERRQLVEELKDSQRHMAELLDFLPDATLVIDREGQVTAWNREIERLTGVKAKNMLGRGNYEYALPFYGERRPILVDLVKVSKKELETKYAHLERRGQVLFGEAYTPKLKGIQTFLTATATVLRDSRGKVVGAIECIRDITDRKKSEMEIQDSRRQLAEIIDFLPDATFVVDAKGKVTAWNRESERLTGIKAKNMLGKNHYECSLLFYGKRRQMLVDMVLEPLERLERDYTAVRRDGDVVYAEGYAPYLKQGGIWFAATAIPLRNADGKIVGAIESIRDVTPRKRIEQALKDNEQRLRRILETTNEGFWMIDNQTVTTDVNDAMCAILKFPRDRNIDIFKSPGRFYRCLF